LQTRSYIGGEEEEEVEEEEEEEDKEEEEVEYSNHRLKSERMTGT
jgi:hypothetical protein